MRFLFDSLLSTFAANPCQFLPEKNHGKNTSNYYSCEDTEWNSNPCDDLSIVVPDAVADQTIIQQQLEKLLYRQLSYCSCLSDIQNLDCCCPDELQRSLKKRCTQMHNTCCTLYMGKQYIDTITPFLRSNKHLEKLPKEKMRILRNRLFSEKRMRLNDIRRTVHPFSLPLVHTMMHYSTMSCDEVDRRMSHNREKSATLITNSVLQSHNESQKEQMTTKGLQRHTGASCSDIPSLLYSSSDEDSVSLKSISGFQNELLYYDSDPGENESTARTRQYQLRPMSFPDCHSAINKEGHLICRSQLRAVLTSAFDWDDEEFEGNDNNNGTDETANDTNAPSNAGLRPVGEEYHDDIDIFFDEQVARQTFNKLINSNYILILHSDLSTSPKVVRVWIERGVKLKKSTIHPKLVLAEDASDLHATNCGRRRFRPASTCISKIQEVDLLSIIRIVSASPSTPLPIDRSKYPFAKSKLCFQITFKRNGVEEHVIFEAVSEKQLKNFVSRLKLVVARFVSKLIVGDLDAVEELYSPWNANDDTEQINQDRNHDEDKETATPVAEYFPQSQNVGIEYMHQKIFES